MRVTAQLKDIRHSPFKMRVMAMAVKKMPVEEARNVLKLSSKKASRYLLKVFESAVANAKNNFALDEKSLVTAEIQIGEGRKLRKPNYRARGQMDMMKSRFSHIRVVLESVERPKAAKKVEKKAKDDKKVETKEEKKA